MISGCKVGVLIPDRGATFAAAFGAVLGQRAGMFFLSPLCDVVGLVTQDHHSTLGFSFDL